MSLAIGPRCRTLARLSSWTRARPSPSPLPSLSGLTGQANDAQTVCRRRGRGHGHGNREYSCLISPSRVPRPTIIPPSQPRSSSSSPPSQPVCPATPLCRNTQVSSFSTARSLKHSSGIVSSRKLDGENYHALADDYLDTLVEKLEEMQEARPDLEVEYSAGVLTIEIKEVGTYVINKQPPNKQIWLSSPVSGPKRFDWAKGGGPFGEWVYARDDSTLTELLREEVGVDMSVGL